MSSMRRAAALFIALLLAPVVTAVSQTNQPAPPAGAVVQPGDLLRLRMWPDQAYSGDYAVESTGQVYLPLLGEIHAGGRPLSAVRSELQDRYRALVQNATVAASVVFRVSVLGAVLRPGLYQVDPSTTILDAISLAGGLRDEADLAGMRVLRGTTSIELHPGTTLVGDQSELSRQLQSGDRIVVPPRKQPRITGRAVLGVVQTIATLAVLALQLR